MGLVFPCTVRSQIGGDLHAFEPVGTSWRRPEWLESDQEEDSKGIIVPIPEFPRGQHRSTQNLEILLDNLSLCSQSLERA